MFFGPVADKNEVIEIPDIEHDIFDYILRYMYTDVCELTGDNVLPILYGAKKYCLPELADRCSIFLEHSVTSDNVCVVYEHAKMYDMNSLVKSCFELMIKDSSAVCNADSSVCLSHDSLLEFLSSEHLTGEELDHFRFVNKWANQKCLSSSMEPTSENKRKVLGEIIKLISYQLIKAEDFARIVIPTKLLSAKEESQIFQYIVTRDKSCIEPFSFPPRTGFPVTIDTRHIKCNSTRDETFCFQFSCNTKVRLVKLFPIQGGKTFLDIIKIHGRGINKQIALVDILDGPDAIRKDIGVTFEANRTYTVDIVRCKQERVVVYTGKNQDDDVQVLMKVARHRGRSRERIRNRCHSPEWTIQEYGSRPHNSNHTFNYGSFSCTIERIPQCVEVVEFKILP
ncbi:BTB (POZ) domain containing 6b [Mactra antiquata]